MPRFCRYIAMNRLTVTGVASSTPSCCPDADGEDENEHVPPIVRMQRDKQRRRRLIAGFKGLPASESSRETSWSSDSASTTSSSQHSEFAPVKPGKASYLFYFVGQVNVTVWLDPCQQPGRDCLCPRTFLHTVFWPANPAQGQFCSPGMGST